MPAAAWVTLIIAALIIAITAVGLLRVIFHLRARLANLVATTGGAKLMARSFDYDWALLQFNDAAPAGASFAAWRAEPLATGAAADTLHHPEGDLTKLSTGATTGYHTYSDGSTFVQMVWQQGVTEPDSSGAGLFTLSPDGTNYELRGGLYGGSSSCRAPRGTDVRPTADRVREALFSILGPLDGLRVLDLFAGTGALGIEALSRGAAHVTFVERDFPVPHVLTLVAVGAWVIAITWMVKQRWLRWLRDDFAGEGVVGR